MSRSPAVARRREARRKAWAQQLSDAPAPDDLAVDPMSTRRRLTVTDILVLAPIAVCAAVGAHVLFTAAVWVAGEWLGNGEEPDESETIVVAVNDEPEPEPEVEPETPEPEPEPEPEPAPEPPKPRPQEPEPEPEPEPPPPPKKIVGLNLDSTVQGGGGPSFATGTDLRGETDRQAVDPETASQEPDESAGEVAEGTNRKATRIPQKGVELTKPKRQTRVVPEYPPRLRAQGIEANVDVEVRLDTSGRVVDARIISPSPYDEMNEQALVAARKERFSPATRNGKAIAFTLTYTVRFRLSD